MALALTSNTDLITDRALPLDAKGSTPLFDSIERAVRLVKGGRNRRKVVVVITDGEDTSSRLNLLELERRIEEADIHLYVIQLWAGSVSDERFALRRISEYTGGIFFGDVVLKQFASVLATMDIHQQYVIAFQPKRTAGKKTFHGIQLRVSAKVKLDAARVFSRSGYEESQPTVR